MPLQLRRGNTAEVNNITPLVGEVVYDTELKRVVIGDGTTAGGIPISGVTTNEAKDASAASILAGTHRNITFSYNPVTRALSAVVDILNHDEIVADALITSKIYDQGSTLVVDVDTARFNGSIKGAVIGDDDSTIVNPTSKAISVTSINLGSAQITQGSGIINVPANTTIGGQPFRIRLGTEDSTITNVDMNDLVNIIGINGIQTTTEAGNITISSTGGLITPQNGESNSHYIMFVDTFNSAGTFKADGNLSYVPSTQTLNFLSGTINLSTVNAPAINTTAVRSGSLTSVGVLTLLSEFNTGGSDQFLVSIGDPTDISKSSRLQVSSNTYFGPAVSLAQFNQHHSTADALNVQFTRSRGTSVTPAAVQSGDDVVDLAFLGYDGSAYVARAAISATVNGAVSAGTVPMRIDIATSVNGAGAPTTAVSINEKQQTTFNGAITVKSYTDAIARDAAIPTPTAGMIIFNTGTGKFQGNVDGTVGGWQDLN